MYLPFKRDIRTKTQSHIVAHSTMYRKVEFAPFLRALNVLAFTRLRNILESIQKELQQTKVMYIEENSEIFGIFVLSLSHNEIFESRVKFPFTKITIS